jgi:hypothetical protein
MIVCTNSTSIHFFDHDRRSPTRETQFGQNREIFRERSSIMRSHPIAANAALPVGGETLGARFRRLAHRTYANWVAAQQERVRPIVWRQLAKQSDSALHELGFTGREIAAIRKDGGTSGSAFYVSPEPV